MAGKKIDISKMSFWNGKYYYGKYYATNEQIRAYKKAMSGNTRTGGYSRSVNVLKPQAKYNKFFGSSIRMTSANGRIANWARPLALRGGKTPEYGWQRIKFDSSKNRWGAKLNRGSLGAGGVLVGSKGWIRQIQISIHQLAVNAEYFRIAVGHRAMKVFQDSFKYQRFWASGGNKWAALSSYTLRKRAKRGTGSKILHEYGDLYKSLRLKVNSERGTEIYTDIVPANSSHHKKHSICYAGYHNEGKGTYGNGWGKRKPKPYIRRQFMGHSDKIDEFAFSIMKRYLFDSVFMVRKV